MSLFVAGTAFGDAAVSLFVAGAMFGDVGVSLFVAVAKFGEIWIDSRSATCFNFQYKMRQGGAGSVLQSHARIMVESAAHCK